MEMVWLAMQRLLVLACSERKRPDPGYMPAIERYDGPAYRVLRRYVQSQSHDKPDIYILSAQYGLIRGDSAIPVYDRRMTRPRALELREAMETALQSLDLGARYHTVFLAAGAVYRELLAPPILRAIPHEQLITSTGSPGIQLTRLKSWLYQDGSLSAASESSTVASSSSIEITFKGTRLRITPNEVVSIVRRATENGMLDGLRSTAWYVLVDGQRIPPKWLVSQLTGVAVGEFHSMDAQRVFNRLGFLVQS
jgi:hypothetical protein